MRLYFILFNSLLSIILLCLIFLYTPSSATVAESVSVSDTTYIPATDIALHQRSDGTWLLDFPTHMCALDQLHSVRDSAAITLSPACAFESTWITGHQLAIHFTETLQPAQHYTLRCHKNMQALDGRYVPTDFSCALDTERPALSSLSQDITGNTMSIIAHFNMDIDANGLHDFIHISDAPEDNSKGVKNIKGVKDTAEKQHAYQLSILSETSVRLTLETPYTSPSTKIVRIDAGLRSPLGPLTSASSVEEQIQLGGAISVRRHYQHNNKLRIYLNTNVRHIDNDYISISPQLRWTVTPSGNRLHCTANFIPNTQYTVTLRQGFPGHGSQRIATDTSLQFTPSPPSPQVTFADAGAVLSIHAQPQLRIRSVNSRSCSLRIRPIYLDNYIFLTQNRHRLPASMYGTAIHVDIPLRHNPQTTASSIVSTIDLSAYLPAADDPAYSPIFEVSIKDHADYWYDDTKIIHLSDINIAARVGHNEAWVSCTSIADGTALAGATVSMFNQQNKKIASGVCDNDGLVLLDISASDDAHNMQTRSVIIAHYNNDHNAIDSISYRSGISSHSQSGRAYTADVAPYLPYDAYIFCDRGLLRPGGQLHATCIIRDTQMRAITASNLEARFYDPRRKLIYQTPIHTNSAGVAQIDQRIERHHPTGSWALHIYDTERQQVISRRTFIVETFIPERMHTQIADSTWTLGSANTCSSSTHWLEGGPATEQAATLYCRYRFAPLTALATDLATDSKYTDAQYTEQHKQWADYHFGALQATPPGAIAPIQALSNAAGVATFTVPAFNPNDTVDRSTWQSLIADVTVEVADPSGRAVRSLAQIPLRRNDAFLGVRSSDSTCDMVFLDTHLQPMLEPQNLRITIDRAQWAYKKRDSQWRWVRRFVPIHSAAIICTNGQHRYDLSSLQLDTSYAHRIRIECADTYSLATECSIGRGYWTRPDYLKVTAAAVPQPDARTLDFTPRTLSPLLSPSLSQELPHTHSITIESPTTGSAILSIEGSRIYSAQRIALSQGKNTINIHIDDTISDPNVHCIVSQHSAQRHRTHSNSYPSLKGSCSIALALATTTPPLTLRIDTPDTIKPQQSVSVQIHAPTATHVCLALVDYGILNITSHPQADPTAYFRQRRALDTIGMTTMNKLLHNSTYADTTLPGGDGALSKRMTASQYLDTSIDPDVPIIAYVSGILSVDAQGLAHHTFTMPNYEGKLRLTAIAVNRTQCIAAAQDIVVSDTIGLRIATPSHLAPGDSCQIPITLANHFPDTHEITYSYTISHSDKPSTSSNRQRITLPAHQRRTVYIPITAPDDGKKQSTKKVEKRYIHIRCTATISNDGQIIARRSLDARIQVQHPQQYAHADIPIVLDPMNSKNINLADNWQSISALTLSTHSNPFAHIHTRMRTLIAYPYGCVEQTTSRCNALLAYRSYHHAGSSDIEQSTIDRHINNGIERLHSMIIPSDGLAWWPNGQAVAAYGTLYAADFLYAADAAGYHVSDQLYDHCLTYAQRILENNRTHTSHLRHYAAFILCRAEKGINHWLDSLERTATQREDRIYMAFCYAIIGDTVRANTFLSDLPQYPHHNDTISSFRSDTRLHALELRLRLRLHPSDQRTHTRAEYLRTRLVNNWNQMHTNARAYAIDGLCTYFALHTPAPLDPSETIHCTINGSTYDAHAAQQIICDPTSAALTISSSHRLYAVLHIEGIRHPQSNAHVTSTAGTTERLHITRKIINIRTNTQAHTYTLGETYRIDLAIHSPQSIEHLAINDILPAGFEALPQRLQQALHNQGLHSAHGTGTAQKTARALRHVSQDMRDDRINTFISQEFSGTYRISYLIRACFAGTFHCRPIHAEAMYNPLQQYDLHYADSIRIEQ